jgi:hypothetical protein
MKLSEPKRPSIFEVKRPPPAPPASLSESSALGKFFRPLFASSSKGAVDDTRHPDAGDAPPSNATSTLDQGQGQDQGQDQGQSDNPNQTGRAETDMRGSASILSTDIKFPQDALFAVLSTGMVVIKHGRQGLPKRRLLQCNSGMTRLYWQPELYSSSTTGLAPDLPEESKSISIKDILAIRTGTDIDPDTDNPSPSPGGSSALGSFMRRSSGIKLGTATLRRRNLSRPELELCLSLILPDRSVNIGSLSNIHLLCFSASYPPPLITWTVYIFLHG